MNFLSLFDASTTGPWETGPHDIQWCLKAYEDKVLLAFQGTWSYIDVFIDAQAWPSKAGFPYGLESIIDALDEITCYTAVVGVDIIISGWSLGGMYAMMAARRLHGARVVTFGSPAVWPRWIKDKGPSDAVHIVHRGDGLIPLYPSIIYKRPGAVIEIGEGPKRFRGHDIGIYRDEIARLGL